MKRRILLLSVLLLCLLAAPAVVLAQDEGIIEGQVMNGTADAPEDSVAGLEVALYQWVGESAELVTTTISDDDGRFRFEGLDTGEDIVYRFELEYQGIVYGAESVFPSGDTVLHVVATIHEITSSDESLVVDRHHIILDFDSDAVVFREFYIFNNVGDRIYAGADGLTLRLALPEGATDITFEAAETGADYVLTQEGLAFVGLVPPGEKQVLYSYSVPYDGSQLTLRREILYPTSNLDLLAANVGVQVEASQLTYEGLTAAGDDTYLHFATENVPSGTAIELQLSGVPQGAVALPSMESSMVAALREAAPAMAVVLAVLGALLPFVQLRLRKARPATAEPGIVPQAEILEQAAVETDAQHEELRRLMSDLDDAYAEGLLTEEAYRQLSDKMKKRLGDTSTD
jgi:5-hydroxyisourate hydrolase-like protein (transthyretin family)